MPSPKHQAIPPSLAWLTILIPALAYYIGSRLESTTRIGGQGTAVVTIDWTADNRIFASSTLFRVQSEGLDDVVDTTWVHDVDLGRGFLLLSQSANHGRIWRWEVGGGPIALGRTLYMEPSGCRSNKTHTCTQPDMGSGGLAVDFGKHGQNHPRTIFEGRLVMAEWGEGRIVRVEAETGARTPLVLHVPSLCSNTLRRLYRPKSMLYTPFGDLLFQDHDPECKEDGLYLLQDALHIPPLESALESRKAHAWTTLPSASNIKVVTKTAFLGGMTLDSTWTGIYLTTAVNGTAQLHHLTLSADDNDDEEEEDDDEEAKITEKIRVVANLTSAGPVTIDQAGNIFVGQDDGVVVLSNELSGKEKLTLSVPAKPTSLTLGEDRFLYVASANHLYRIRVKKGPLRVPTDLIRKPKSRSKRS